MDSPIFDCRRLHVDSMLQSMEKLTDFSNHFYVDPMQCFKSFGIGDVWWWCNFYCCSLCFFRWLVVWTPLKNSSHLGWLFPYTSSAAQGGGGSFKNRKPIGEVGCCESEMAERSHWWTERCLISLTLSISFSDYLPTYLFSMYLSIYRSIYLSLSLSFI